MNTGFQLTTQFFDAVKGLDATEIPRQAFFGILHPDAEYDVTEIMDIPDEGVWIGREAVVDGWYRWMESWSDYRIRGENLTPHGDHVVVDIVVEARGRALGVPVTMHQVQVWLWRGRQLFSVRAFRDRAAAVSYLDGVSS